MKILTACSFIVFVLMLGCGQPESAPASEMASVVQTVESMPEEPESVLRHVVLFSFKETSTPEDIKQIEEAFRALPSKIDAIHDLEWGTDVSVEGRAQGFTHCFLVTFLSEEDRATYLPHPDHEAFGTIVTPHLKDVLVVDYWSGK